MRQGRQPVALRRALAAALGAGFAAAVANNAWSLVYTTATGFSLPAVINIATVTLASMLPMLMAGAVFWALTLTVRRAEIWFALGAAIVTVRTLYAGPLSATLPNGQPTPAGFAGLTLPMHLLTGLCAAWLLPRLARATAARGTRR